MFLYASYNIHVYYCDQNEIFFPFLSVTSCAYGKLGLSVMVSVMGECMYPEWKWPNSRTEIVMEVNVYSSIVISAAHLCASEC